MATLCRSLGTKWICPAPWIQTNQTKIPNISSFWLSMDKHILSVPLFVFPLGFCLWSLFLCCTFSSPYWLFLLKQRTNFGAETKQECFLRCAKRKSTSIFVTGVNCSFPLMEILSVSSKLILRVSGASHRRNSVKHNICILANWSLKCHYRADNSFWEIMQFHLAPLHHWKYIFIQKLDIPNGDFGVSW